MGETSTKIGEKPGAGDSRQRIFVYVMLGLFTVFLLFSMLGLYGQLNVFFACGDGFMADTTKMLRDYLSGDSPYQTITADPSRSGSYLPISFLLYQAIWLISGGAEGTEIQQQLAAAFLSFGSFALLAAGLRRMRADANGAHSDGMRADMLCAALCVSGIAMNALERGNFIVLTAALCVFYINHYADENRLLRELSFLALAVAAALKIVPALLGVLLLTEKRWKDAARLLFYGVVLAIGPFLCFDHIDLSIRAMLENMTVANAIANTRFDMSRFGYRTLEFFADCLRISNAGTGKGEAYANLLRGLQTVFPALNYLAAGLALLTLPLQTVRWKKWAVLFLIMTLLPSFSIMYTGLYLFPAAMLYLCAGREERARRDAIYLPLFLCIFNPVQICRIIPGIVHVFSKEPVILNTSAIIMNLAAYLMLILLAVEGGLRGIQWARERKAGRASVEFDRIA